MVDRLGQRGDYDDTLIMVTSDHGDQLGDFGPIDKLGYFAHNDRVVGIWRDPRVASSGRVVAYCTEYVDIAATLTVACGGPLRGGLPGSIISSPDTPWPFERSLSRANLSALVNEHTSDVQCRDGPYQCSDLDADPTWRRRCHDQSRTIAAAQVMLVRHHEHLARECAPTLIEPQWAGVVALRTASFDCASFEVCNSHEDDARATRQGK